MSYSDLIKKRLRLVVAHKDSFKKIFSVSIKPFIHPVNGFDIVLFSEYIQSTHGDYFDLYQIVEDAYGADGAELLAKLIKESE
jgi:hypothetical protein